MFTVSDLISVGCGDYESFAGSCYKFYAQVSAWSAAQSLCEAEGGFLTDIHSQQEQDYVFGTQFLF